MFTLLVGPPATIRILIVAGAAIAGFFAPSMYLYQKAHDRSNQMSRELPDAIDLLTISVESGLGFDAALQQVARNTEGPLADEFSRMLREMQIGSGRSASLRALAERTNVPDIRSFVSAMVQADAFGIPIAQVLRVQSSEIRIKRRQRAEEKAQQVPVKITIPLIFCILPCLFIAVMGPAAISIMDSFSSMRPAHPQFPRLAVGARIFGLAILAVPLLWSGEDTGLLALLTIGIIWSAAVAAERIGLNSVVASTVECALVGAVCGLTLEAAPAVLGSLAVPPFIASLRRGPRGMALALSAELATLVGVALLTHGPLNPSQGTETFTWVLTGVGLRPDRQLRALGDAHARRSPPAVPRRPGPDPRADRDLRGTHLWP